MRRLCLVIALWVLALAGCSSGSPLVGMEPMMRPTAGASTAADRTVLRGTFVKLTGFPCHRSDPYVGGEAVIFRGSDGSRTRVVTGSANWIGLPATEAAPLGQCRQVAPFEVELPIAERYVVLINDRRLPPVTLAELRADGMRHIFRLPG